jgi:adenylate cyclase
MNRNHENAMVAKDMSFIGLYIHNLGANLVGFVTIVLLNVFTPYEFFRIQRSILFLQGGWPEFFQFFPMAMGLVFLIQFRIQVPLANTKRRMIQGVDIDDQLWESARKRLLNLPFIIALVNLLMYVFMPGLVALSFFFFGDIPLQACLFLFFRAAMLGVIASGLSFFLIEDYSRRRLIPHFFPQGRLAAQKGTIKLPVYRRIRLLYGTGTLNPLILMVFTLIFVLWDIKEHPIPTERLAKEIFFFTVVLCGIFIPIALRLNFLVGRSISSPIHEMLGVVDSVREGNFKKRIKVITNDEIGLLGDVGNGMIKGLAERERIRETFGKYVTPEIRDQILAGRIPLDGEKRVATLLFTDLRDFTSYVEKTPTEEVFRSMRAYFTAMQKVIHRHRGLVLQYVGDEIEAVFGVPIDYDSHPDEAVLAAIGIKNELALLNRARVSEEKPPFRHGIGIHTGVVLAGNTGSEDRLSYALIGDTVNVASRIQNLTKTMNCDILISEETVHRLKRPFPLKREGTRAVKGRSRPVVVYRLLEGEPS